MVFKVIDVTETFESKLSYYLKNNLFDFEIEYTPITKFNLKFKMKSHESYYTIFNVKENSITHHKPFNCRYAELKSFLRGRLDVDFTSKELDDFLQENSCYVYIDENRNMHYVRLSDEEIEYLDGTVEVFKYDI